MSSATASSPSRMGAWNVDPVNSYICKGKGLAELEVLVRGLGCLWSRKLKMCRCPRNYNDSLALSSLETHPFLRPMTAGRQRMLVSQ